MPYIYEKGLRPDKLADLLFSFVDRLQGMTRGSVPIGFEKAMLENVSKWFLKREMKARNKFLQTRELKWDTDKNMRIETRLLPRYMSGVVYHQSGMGDIEHELMRFPYGTHDDLIDAAQGLVQLLQFPKAKQATPDKENEFAWWQKQANTMWKPQKKRFVGRFHSGGPYTQVACEGGMEMKDNIITYDVIQIRRSEFDKQEGDMDKVRSLVEAKAKLAVMGTMSRLKKYAKDL